MVPFFGYVGETAEAVGNSLDVEAGSLTWAALLDAYEQVEWQPDEFGVVQKPQIVAGEKAAQVIAGLGEMPLDQKVRLVMMAHRKQEAHVSRRRGRRLR